MIFIPKTITAGYQKRGGTVDGHLAYVVYTDEKGVLRKEASFNSWRDSKIPTVEFENTPVKGIMLNYANRNPYGNGWDDRMAFIRIYDPRGMEFEIDAEILVYMLKTGGYSVEDGFGEVVYAWDGPRLLLLATSSSDYTKIVSESDLVHKSEYVTVPDLVVGNVYVRKTGKKEIYLGRFEAWTEFRSWDKDDVQRNRGLMHVFCTENGGFTVTKSISKTYLHDNGPVTDWEAWHGWSFKPDGLDYVMDKWYGSSESSPLDWSKDENVPLTVEDFNLPADRFYFHRSFMTPKNSSVMDAAYDKEHDAFYVYPENNSGYGYYRMGYGYRNQPERVYLTAQEIIDTYEPYKVQHYLANGRKYYQTP